MDIEIIQAVLDVFYQNGESIRYDIERFEEVLNDKVPYLIDECYLIVLGMKTSVYDALIFDWDIDIKAYCDYLKEILSLSERETLFMLAMLVRIVKEMGYYFEIPYLDKLIDIAYQIQDNNQLFYIGMAYFKGYGVKQDYEKAFEIFSDLYQQGYSQCAYYLGCMYEEGLGVEQDIDQALSIYSQHLDSLCEYRLATLYMLGKYVEQDAQKAYDHYASSQEKEAYFYQGYLLEQKKDYAAAFEAYYQGAQLFQSDCLYKAGMFLKIGLGVDRDEDKAYRCFEYGYFLLHEQSTFQLAMLLLEGIFIEQDVDKAIHYLKQASMLNSQEACFMLARFYGIGKYVERNQQLSLYYYQRGYEINR